MTYSSPRTPGPASGRIPSLHGLRDALRGPFRAPPTVWKPLPPESSEPPTVPWSERDLGADGLAPGVPRPGELPTPRPRHAKRNLVVIGQYLADYGRWRGVFAIVLLLAAIHLPSLLVAPPGVNLSIGAAPYFLSPLGGAHKAVVHIVAAIALIGALVLPMWLRGSLLLALGLTPIVLYVAILQSGAEDIGQNHALQVFRDHIVALHPLWILLSGGLVSLQSFPDDSRVRGVVLTGAGLLLVRQFFLWGSLWTHAICAVTGGLAVLLVVAAIVVVLRRSQIAAIRLVRVGWLYVLVLPALYYTWLYELPEMAEASGATRFLALHGLVYAVAAFAIATVGLVDVLHAIAWRSEVRATLGSNWIGADPSSLEFSRRFMEFAAASGRFSPAEITFLQRALVEPHDPGRTTADQEGES